MRTIWQDLYYGFRGMLKQPAFTGLAVLALAGIAFSQAKPEDSITPEALRSHVRFLSDDLLEGRGTGTRGHEIAAHYIRHIARHWRGRRRQRDIQFGKSAFDFSGHGVLLAKPLANPSPPPTRSSISRSSKRGPS